MAPVSASQCISVRLSASHPLLAPFSAPLSPSQRFSQPLPAPLSASLAAPRQNRKQGYVDNRLPYRREKSGWNIPDTKYMIFQRGRIVLKNPSNTAVQPASNVITPVRIDSVMVEKSPVEISPAQKKCDFLTRPNRYEKIHRIPLCDSRPT